MTEKPQLDNKWLDARKAFIAATQRLSDEAWTICVALNEIHTLPASASDRVKLAAHFTKQTRALEAYLQAQIHLRQLLESGRSSELLRAHEQGPV